MKAQIVLFVHTRLHHTRCTIDALLNNIDVEKHDLIIYSDSYQSDAQREEVENVRSYLRTISGFRSVKIRHRKTNFGLSKSIVNGVSEVLTETDRVIVLEDDMVTSPYFLMYMNEALARYEDDDRVVSIHGYVYPVSGTLPEFFFLKGADCWGWATWRRGWSIYNPNGKHLYDQLHKRKLLKQFDFNGAYKYSDMLKDQIKGKNDSWAVKWYASAFLANKLTLYPGRSLVQNIGNDSSGTHCCTSNCMNVELSKSAIVLSDVPVEPSESANKEFKEFFLSIRKSLFDRIVEIIKSFFFNNDLKKSLKHYLNKVYMCLFAKEEQIRFDGPFESWEDASDNASGYDSNNILEKVLEATLKVKNGLATYERDSITFEDHDYYSWPCAAALLYASGHVPGQLSVLDFGGALGSSYYQNRTLISRFKNLRWSIVEQKHFVDAGRAYIEDEIVKFYETIDECLEKEQPNIVICSSVLQYLKSPYDIISKLRKCNAFLYLIERTPFSDADNDTLAVQFVPASIYTASYPMWIFSEKKFLTYFADGLKQIVSTISPEGRVKSDVERFAFKSMLFIK